MVTTRNRPSYSQLLAQASQLDPEDQLRLLEGLAVLLRQQMSHEAPHRITALRGLGHEVWQSMDAQEYVNRERATWDG